MISIREIADCEEKISIMKACDDAFPIKLFERADCEEIIKRITTFALFFAAFNKDNDKESVAGYVAFYANDVETKTAYISNIGVLEEYQEKGIGGDLLDVVIDNAQKEGMCKIRLEVLNSNEKAIDFYRHKGFSFAEKGKENTSYMVMAI